MNLITVIFFLRLVLLISFCILSIFFRKSFIRIASMWCCNSCVLWKAIISFKTLKKKRKKYKSYLINGKVWVNGYWTWSPVYGQRINSHNTRKEHHNSCIHVGFKFKYLHWNIMLVRWWLPFILYFVAWGLSLHIQKIQNPTNVLGRLKK